MKQARCLAQGLQTGLLEFSTFALALLVALLAQGLSPNQAAARGNGIGTSELGSSTCSLCHTSTLTSTVTSPDFPAYMNPGETRVFRMWVSASSTRPGAGINVYTSWGKIALTDAEAMSSTPTTKVLNGGLELTHTSNRKTCTAASCNVEFSFKFTAPTSAGTTAWLDVRGNNVNGNGSSTGDAPSPWTSFKVVTRSPVGGSCSVAQECPSGMYCTGGVCCYSASCAAGNATCTSAPYCGSNGQCVLPTRNEGVACNDSNGCTTGDRCQTGQCKGSAVSCYALDECHLAGTCSNNACSNPVKTDGTSCVGQSSTNQCVLAGTCQTGACQNPPAASTALCDDRDLSTRDDRCNGAGLCRGTPEPGNVWIWGDGYYGQLGDGRYGAGVVAAQPKPLASPSNIIQAAVGNDHVLLLGADGELWSFGKNDFGQLGQGTIAAASAPPVTVPTRMYANYSFYASRMMVAGSTHSMVLEHSGTVKTSGSNSYGELGFSGAASAAPNYNAATLPALAGAAGANFSVIIKADGTVWAWGKNDQGQLGLGDTANRSAPTQVPLSVRAKAVAAGLEHVYVLATTGEVYAWGSNFRGALAQAATVTRSLLPVKISALSGIRRIASGHHHGLAVRSDGKVLSWGDNTLGQLGNGTSNNTSITPAALTTLSNVIEIAAGAVHSVALLANGTVSAWGDNSAKQLGNPSYTMATSPVTVTGLSKIFALAVGDYTTLALEAQGTVQTWGLNDFGQLGVGQYKQTLPTSTLPRLVSSLTTPIKRISVGCSHMVALGVDGTMWGWGNNATGALAHRQSFNNGPVAVPLQGVGLSNVVALSTGCTSTFALLADGRVMAMGGYGKGTGSSGDVSSYTPTQVLNFTDFIEISSEGWLTTGLRANGTVVTWQEFSTPAAVAMPGNATARSVASGNNARYAILGDGTVAAWGNNDRGQLGNGTTSTTVQTVPTLVSSLTNVTQVAGGHSTGYALSRGRQYGWGYNAYRQLNEFAPAPQLTPALVFEIYASGAWYSWIGPGLYTNYAIGLGRAVMSLGSGTDGALGNGTTVGWYGNNEGARVGNLSEALQVEGGTSIGAALIQ